MTSFSCHILLDQSVTIFKNCFFSFSERLIKFVNCSLFYTFIFRFFKRVQVLSSLCHFSRLRSRGVSLIFLIFIRAFSSHLFSVHSTMIQPYFTPQFLKTIFSLFQSALSAVFCSAFLHFLAFYAVRYRSSFPWP